MGKSKNKSKSEVEHLRGEIRRLKAELKYCKRCFEQGVDDLEDYDGVAPMDEDVPVKKGRCSECGKGTIMEYDFKYATLTKCDTCGHEERKRKQ